MGEITTAHIAIIVAALGLVVPILTGLAIFFLQRLFGSDDKTAAQITALTQSVHRVELGQRDAETNIRDHVGTRYATKDDIGRVEKAIAALAESQRQYHETLQTILKPLADQLIGVSPVRR